MFGHGKCPKCEAPISHLEIDSITWGDKLNGPIFRAISGCCPKCKTVVGAAIDPTSQKNDIVSEVLAGLGVAPKKSGRR